MLMLDICCGSKGASQAMLERGWEVLTVDNDPIFKPDKVADVRNWVYDGAIPDLIWCSPPCHDFAREFMPWSATGNAPDMSIVLACLQIIKTVGPNFWVIENVQGAINWFVPYLGKYRASIGPFFLWGFFPALGEIDRSNWRNKETRSSTAVIERSKIPYELSLALALAIEKQPTLL